MTLLNEFLKEHKNVEAEEATIAQLKKDLQTTAAQQQEEIKALTATLKQQAKQIERVNNACAPTKPFHIRYRIALGGAPKPEFGAPRDGAYQNIGSLICSIDSGQIGASRIHDRRVCLNIHRMASTLRPISVIRGLTPFRRTSCNAFKKGGCFRVQEASKKVAEWWGDPQIQVPGTQWVEVPGISENVNFRASGDSAIDWVNHSASLLSRFTRPIKALSLGCGFGVIERILRRRDYCQLIHGVDVADAAIQGARKAAEAEGLDGLTYEVADLNTATFPAETYDAVYAHAALHHVFELEQLLDQIKQTLKPGGLLIVYEYIGPSQMQFPQQHLELADVFLRVIPKRYRKLQSQEDIKKEAFRASLDAMNSSDPSEGIRASEIVPLVASRFEVRHFRYVGGTLLLLVFNEIAGNFVENDPEIMPLVDALITLDNFLIDNKVLPSYHVYMVCEKTDNLLPIQTCNALPPTAAMFPTNHLEALTIKPKSMGLIAAEPNPFRVNSEGVGRTTLSWMTYATSKVEVHVDAPDGLLFARSGAGRFSHETGEWVRDGTTFYLQNVSGRLPLTSENTIAMVTVKSA